MKLSLVSIFLVLLVMNSESSNRTDQKKVNRSVYRTSRKAQQIIYVPIPVSTQEYLSIPLSSSEQLESGQDLNLFPHIVSIIGNVGRIALHLKDKNKDRERLVDTIAHLIGNIYNCAQDLHSRGPLSNEHLYAIAQCLADQWLSFSAM